MVFAKASNNLKEKEGKCTLQRTVLGWDGVPHILVKWEPLEGEEQFQTFMENMGSLIAQLVKNQPAKQETLVWFLGQEDLLEKGYIPTPVFLGFLCGSAGKESTTCNAGDLSLIPELGRSPGEGKGYPLQYSGLENSMDCIDHGVTKSWTRLSDFHFHFLLCLTEERIQWETKWQMSRGYI